MARPGQSVGTSILRRAITIRSSCKVRTACGLWFRARASGRGRTPASQQLQLFPAVPCGRSAKRDRKSTRLNSSHRYISYAGFCLEKKINKEIHVQLEHAK